MGRIQTTVFAPSLSNFTCKLWITRGWTLLILDHGVKGQGHFWHSEYKTLWAGYRLQFLHDRFQTPHLLWMMRGGTLVINGQRSRSTLPPCEGMPRFALSSLNIISTSMHLLLWMNIMLDFICTAFAEVLWMGGQWTNQNENICIHRESNKQPLTLQAGA